MKKLFKSFLILSAIAMAIPCFAQTPNTCLLYTSDAADD